MSCRSKENRDDIEIALGAKYKYRIALVEVAEDGTETPFDLTGYSLIAKIGDDAEGDPYATFTGTITDAINGQADLDLTEAETSTIPEGTHEWDLFLRDGSSRITGPFIWGLAVCDEYISVP